MRKRLIQGLLIASGLLLTVSFGATPAAAWVTTAVPEIDGASLAAGIGLLGAGVMMLRARLRNR